MNIVQRVPIHKGWSDDRKYCITDDNGTSYLLRISALDSFEPKEREFRFMQQVEKLGIPMCRPINFFVSDEGVCSIQSWITGQDAEIALLLCSLEEQYRYGLQAGHYLRLIHTIPAPENIESWETRYKQKIARKIEAYRKCPVQYEHGDRFVNYALNHQHMLQNRPQTFQHGDYHVGNMMIDGNGILHIIDFNRSSFGDPWQEFDRIVWCAQKVPTFASGLVDGYFEKKIPLTFWELLALYIAGNALSSLPWAIPFGEDEISVMQQQAQEILAWYNHMTTLIPSWYCSHPEIPFPIPSKYDKISL